tara:strand:+ start:98 stop:472 length:375 start_codon:yes stop_codon:yes gene_type:complete
MYKLSLLLIFLPFLLIGQGIDLQLNQVLLVDNTDTVPTGKVWKITNIMPDSNFSDGHAKIIINNKEISVAFSVSENGQTSSSGNFGNNHNYYNSLSGAYWLPETTTLSRGQQVEYISVLEFNTQ